MSLVESLEAKVASLVGKTVTQATIAENTLLLWVGAPPKARNSVCLWLDPPWRILSAGKFLVGSAEFPWKAEEFESEAKYKAEFNRVCNLCRCTEGQSIEGATYEPASADLELYFSEGLHFRSFATIGNEEHWHLSEYGSNSQFRVSPGVVSVAPIDP